MDLIQYIDRNSKAVLEENIPGKGWLRWLYHKPLGKLSLNAIVKRKLISSLAGWYMNQPSSAKQIHKFVEEHGVDMSEYLQSEISDYTTFNEFFYRKLNVDKRPVGNDVVSPADGKILAFQNLGDVRSFFVKGQEFTLESFLNDALLAKNYSDGAMAIIRLAPADYHRFHFPVNGEVSESKQVKGCYYSVSPMALNKSLDIFCQNKREYSIIKSEKGNVLYCEVGATMVGSIIQTYRPNSVIEKGQEKGYFAFGGSTIVLLFAKNKIIFDADLLANTANGYETSIRMGESIAK